MNDTTLPDFVIPTFPLLEDVEKKYNIKIVQVDNGVSSTVMLDRVNKALENALKDGKLSIQSRACAIYLSEFDRYVLLENFSVVQGPVFKRICHVLSQIKSQFENDRYITKRELFYTDPGLFNNKQVRCDETLDKIARLLKCSRDCLRVHAVNTGSAVGDFTVDYDGSISLVGEMFTIDYSKADFGGKAIPVLAKNIKDVKSMTAKFVLLVESNAVLSSLQASRFHLKYNCIIISGSGFPSISVRKFVRKVSLMLKLPVLALMDCDPAGFMLVNQYKFGNDSTSYDGELTTPNIHWLGIWPSDIENHEILRSCQKPLTQLDENVLNSLKNSDALNLNQHDVNVLNSLKNSDALKERERWRGEIEYMLKTKKKIDFMVSYKTDFSWLAEMYLPSKLSSLSWI